VPLGLTNRSRALTLVENHVLRLFAPAYLSCLRGLPLLLVVRVLCLFQLLEISLGDEPEGGVPHAVDPFDLILQKLAHLRPACVSMDSLESRIVLLLAGRLRVLFLSQGVGSSFFGEILPGRKMPRLSFQFDHGRDNYFIFYNAAV